MIDKETVRTKARLARQQQTDKDAISELITSRLVQMPEYKAAKCVMWYVDIRSEVRTRPALGRALTDQQKIVVPYCDGDQLGLFHLQSNDDLVPGSFGILEPDPQLRKQTVRTVTAADLDLVVVPGLAFDAFGGRLGYGKGFYDRMLMGCRPGTVLVGLAYECQVYQQIPMDKHDVPLTWLATEQRLIRCDIRSGVRADGEDW